MLALIASWCLAPYGDLDEERAFAILKRGLQVIVYAGQKPGGAPATSFDVTNDGGIIESYLVKDLEFSSSRVVFTQVQTREFYTRDGFQSETSLASLIERRSTETTFRIPYDRIADITICSPPGTSDRYGPNERESSTRYVTPSSVQNSFRVVINFDRTLPVLKRTFLNDKEVSAEPRKTQRNQYVEDQSLDSILGELGATEPEQANTVENQVIVPIDTSLLVFFSAEGYARDLSRALATVTNVKVPVKVQKF